MTERKDGGAAFGIWQPIETAPKDGAAFLASSDGWQTACCWNKYRNDWCCVAPGYPPYPHDERPTYWTPMPETPARKEGSDQ